MTSPITPRSALPFAAAMAGAFFLATAVAHVVVVRAPLSPHPAGFNVLQAEIHACVAAGGRTHDECLDEIEGKALIQDAEQAAQGEERQGSSAADASEDVAELDAAAPAPRSGAR
jgi:hypothetical protein